MIVIVDYGMGNLGSIQNMIRKAGGDSMVSSKIEDIEQADKLVLPGVGAFDTGVKNIDQLGLRPVLDQKVLKEKTPTLGICLGMHLLTRGSEEGTLPGFGWIDGGTVKFRFEGLENHLKIPHMGWNTIRIHRNHRIFEDFEEGARFYFVHSYHVVCDQEDQEEQILAKTHYGYDFASAIQKENIIGVQFHPEKSHKFGMKVFKNFVERV